MNDADFTDLLHKLRGFELPVTLKVGFIEGELGTLVPDQYWEGDDVLRALADLLDQTAELIRRDIRERGGQ